VPKQTAILNANIFFFNENIDLFTATLAALLKIKLLAYEAKGIDLTTNVTLMGRSSVI